MFNFVTIYGHKNQNGDEFTYAAGPGVRGGIKEFGSGAISNNKSSEQLVDHWHLSGFNAWML
jgi:hypothetical protein